MLRATIAVCEVWPPTSVTKPANTLLLELQHVGRRRGRARPAPAGPRRRSPRGLTPARAAAQAPSSPRASTPQHALDHLLEVGLALAQVLVLHLVELARQHLELRRQRPLGVVVALADPVLGARRSAPRRAAASGARRAAPTARPAPRSAGRAAARRARRRPRRARCAGARSRPRLRLRVDEVVRDVDAAGRDQHRAPDRDAARDRQAEDLEAHGPIASSGTLTPRWRRGIAGHARMASRDARCHSPTRPRHRRVMASPAKLRPIQEPEKSMRDLPLPTSPLQELTRREPRSTRRSLPGRGSEPGAKCRAASTGRGLGAP